MKHSHVVSNGFPTVDLASLLLRLALGCMYIAHALYKILVLTWPGTIKLFASTGMPEWMSYPAVFAELAGGMFLVVGIAVRSISLMLLPMLIGAIIFVHGANGWIYTSAGGGWEYLAFLIVVSLAVACLGSGRYALHQKLAGLWPSLNCKFTERRI